MIEIEKMGKPAVPIISGRFEGDAIASSRAFGMPDLRFVIVPRIYRNLSPEDSIRNTEPAFDELVRMLTVEVDGNGAAYSESVEDVARFEGEDRLDAMLRMNQDYLRRDWGDGFLLMPATRSAIDDLLGGTRLAPDHVVCDMPPGFGIATVEKSRSMRRPRARGPTQGGQALVVAQCPDQDRGTAGAPRPEAGVPAR